MAKTEVLGISYDNVTLSEAAEMLLDVAGERRARVVVTPNPEISEGCVENEKLRKAVRDADFVFPDGIGVVMASRVLKRPLKERVGGYDLVLAMLPEMEKRGMSLYILGARPGVADQAAKNLTARYPRLRIVGTQHGYFDDGAAVAEQIGRTSPDFVFVALGSPRQELWMEQYRGGLSAGVLMGLGGSVDIFAGVAKRAPEAFIRLNLEWFYRLLCEPARFVRMLKLPKYLLRAYHARLFGHDGAKAGD